MTVPLDTVNDIRSMDAAGRSRSEIARMLHVSRNTVAKYADMEDMSPAAPMPRRRGRPALEGNEEWVAGVLEADLGAPRKQRHTARRIYDRLVAERGYGGSYSTVQRFVRELRLARAAAGGEGYLELEWAPGTCQVDFGNFRAAVGGRTLDLKLLVATLPHSNDRQCVALMSQRSELAGYLEAERSSREASKRATLLRRCALPAPKTFDGYDWSAVSWPEGMGRESLLALDFVGRREDLVLMGDVGTGKTHMASALCALACERRLEARFFTASSLVMRLRRARDDGRLDREAALIGKARLLVIDELGFLPLDADGARLLFQVFADAYERQSVVITTNLEFSRWGSVFGDDQMAAAVIDRIVHHGRLVQFRGESYRVRHALMQEG